MTLQEMRDKVKIDANVLENEMFPNTRLNEMINQAQRAIQVKLNGLGMKRWEASEDYSTLTDGTFYNYNVTTVSLPTDYLEGDNLLHAETTSSSISGIAYEVSFPRFPELLRNSYLRPTSQKPTFVRIENSLSIYPRVTAFKLYYRKYLADLTDSDECQIPKEYHDLVVDKTVLEVKKILNHQGYPVESQKLDKEIEDTYVKELRNKQERTNESIGN